MQRMEAGNMIKDGIDLKESAAFLGVGMTKMYEIAKQPDFPSYPVGRKILVSFEGLKQWQQKQIELYRQEKTRG